jgi:hypothetical protein
MKLQFHSRDGCLVTVPGAALAVGQPKRYVGRRLVKLKDGVYADVATEEPYAVEEGTKTARRLIKLTQRDQSLWPADEHTAEACGVPFTPVKQGTDGEWIAAEEE